MIWSVVTPCQIACCERGELLLFSDDDDDTLCACKHTLARITRSHKKRLCVCVRVLENLLRRHNKAARRISCKHTSRRLITAIISFPLIVSAARASGPCFLCAVITRPETNWCHCHLHVTFVIPAPHRVVW